MPLALCVRARVSECVSLPLTVITESDRQSLHQGLDPASVSSTLSWGIPLPACLPNPEHHQQMRIPTLMSSLPGGLPGPQGTAA